MQIFSKLTKTSIMKNVHNSMHYHIQPFDSKFLIINFDFWQENGLKIFQRKLAQNSFNYRQTSTTGIAEESSITHIISTVRINIVFFFAKCAKRKLFVKSIQIFNF